MITIKTLKITNEEYEKIKDLLNREVAKDKAIKDLKDLVGQKFTFWCARYIYHGKVKAVNSTFITLEDAGIVYETGEFNAKEPVDRQATPNEIQVLWNAVESFMKLKW